MIKLFILLFFGACAVQGNPLPPAPKTKTCSAGPLPYEVIHSNLVITIQL